MTELNEQALDKAAQAIGNANLSNIGVPYPASACRRDAEVAIRAYLAATPIPSEVILAQQERIEALMFQVSQFVSENAVLGSDGTAARKAASANLSRAEAAERYAAAKDETTKEWLAAREAVLAEPVADARTSASFAAAMLRLGNAERALADLTRRAREAMGDSNG